jgi:excisionase family DNA binding protein
MKMQKVHLTITASNGRIIITPPPGVELVLQEGASSIDAPDDWRTIAEAAEEFGISKNTLSKLCDNGRIPCEMRGRNRFVRARDVAGHKPGRPGRKPKGE